jgi:hypothetical protein
MYILPWLSTQFELDRLKLEENEYHSAALPDQLVYLQQSVVLLTLDAMIIPE